MDRRAENTVKTGETRHKPGNLNRLGPETTSNFNHVGGENVECKQKEQRPLIEPQLVLRLNTVVIGNVGKLFLRSARGQIDGEPPTDHARGCDRPTAA